MIDDQPTQPHDDKVDFEGSANDPAALYTTPDAVVADSALTDGQKRSFLTAWAQDIEDRQVGVDEGMSPATTAGSDNDAQRLQRIRDCLASLPDDADEKAPPSALARIWRWITAK